MHLDASTSTRPAAQRNTNSWKRQSKLRQLVKFDKILVMFPWMEPFFIFRIVLIVVDETMPDVCHHQTEADCPPTFNLSPRLPGREQKQRLRPGQMEHVPRPPKGHGTRSKHSAALTASTVCGWRTVGDTTRSFADIHVPALAVGPHQHRSRGVGQQLGPGRATSGANTARPSHRPYDIIRDKGGRDSSRVF